MEAWVKEYGVWNGIWLTDTIGDDYNADFRPLAEMTWLKNLWINGNGVSQADRKYLTEALPDTRIEFDAGWITGNGWRELQNYFDMRDLLGMPYNPW